MKNKKDGDTVEMVKKIINFEIKQVGEEKDRVLRFIGSDETPDRDDDIIEVAGWKTEEYMSNPVFLWAHRYDMPPVGKCIKVEKDLASKKLIFDIKFPTIAELSSDIENPAEHAKFIDMIYNMYKGKYLNATSVGFRGVKFKTRDDDKVLEKPEWMRGRRYMEQNLLELSAVPVPSNPSALQTAKSIGLIDEMQIKSFFMEKTSKKKKKGMTKSMKTKAALNSANKNHIHGIADATRTMMGSAKMTPEGCPCDECMTTDCPCHPDNAGKGIKAGSTLNSQNKECLEEIYDCCREVMGSAKMTPNGCPCDECENMECPCNCNEEMEEEPEDVTEGLDSDGVADQDGGASDGREKPRGYKDLMKAVKGLTKEIGHLKTDISEIKEASKAGEIDLDAIEFKDEKNAADDELSIKPEELVTLIETTLEKKIRQLSGKID
jgi:hypothetical protein